jgi:hypothetical protein
MERGINCAPSQPMGRQLPATARPPAVSASGFRTRLKPSRDEPRRRSPPPGRRRPGGGVRPPSRRAAAAPPSRRPTRLGRTAPRARRLAGRPPLSHVRATWGTCLYRVHNRDVRAGGGRVSPGDCRRIGRRAASARQQGGRARWKGGARAGRRGEGGWAHWQEGGLRHWQGCAGTLSIPGPGPWGRLTAVARKRPRAWLLCETRML